MQQHDQGTTIRLLSRFYGIFVLICLFFLAVGVPFIFYRKAVSALLSLLMIAAVLACWRMSSSGQPEKSLKIFSAGLWLLLVGLLYAGLPPGTISPLLAVTVVLAVVVSFQTGVIFAASYFLAWLLYIVLKTFDLAPAPYFAGARMTGWVVGVASIFLLLLPLYELVQRLRRALALERTVIDAASDGILVVDTQGQVEAYNKRFDALWQPEPGARQFKQASDLLQVALKTLVDPKVFEQTVQDLNTQLDRSSSDTLHFLDGRIVEAFSQPRLLDARHVGRVWSFHDITDQTRTQERLRHSKEQFEAVLNATTESIFMVDRQGIILIVNDTAARRVGTSPQNMVGQCAFDYFPPEVAVTRRATLDEVFASGQVINIKDSRDGRFFSLNYYPVFEAPGHVASVVVFAMNITELKRAEAAALTLVKRHALLMQTATDGIHILDTEGHLVECNEAFARMLGYDTQELTGCHVTLWDAQLTLDQMSQRMPEVVAHGATLETVHRRKDGTLFDAEVHISSVCIEGQVLLYAASRDITARLKAHRDMAQLAQRNQLLLDSVGDGIFEVDATGLTTYCNPAALTLLGLTEQQLLGQSSHAVFHHHYPDGRPYPAEECPVHQTLKDGQRRQVASDWFWRPDGSGFHVSMVATLTLDNEHNKGVVVVFQDITERKNAELEMHRMAFHDALTRLPNRRLLHDRLAQMVVSCRRDAYWGALLFLDLDKFKPLNDAHGHAVGDLLLLEVARRITACVREIDTVSRFGGDEFVVMLGKLDTDPATARLYAERIAEKIREALAKPYCLRIAQADGSTFEVHHRCTSSIGLTMFGQQVTDVHAILNQADQAMYCAKDAGCNTVSCYTSLD